MDNSLVSRVSGCLGMMDRGFGNFHSELRNELANFKLLVAIESNEESHRCGVENGTWGTPRARLLKR